jgi:hypothetical protein
VAEEMKLPRFVPLNAFRIPSKSPPTFPKRVYLLKNVHSWRILPQNSIKTTWMGPTLLGIQSPILLP